jgi:hypothetical protein
MRKVKFKMMLIAAISAFTLLLAGVERGHAQSNFGGDPFVLPTGNFVGAAEADVLLSQQVINLKNILVTLTPGTAAYKTVERAILYYSLIQSEVASGKDIPQSILTGLEYISIDIYGGASNLELLGLRTESIDMLDY